MTDTLIAFLGMVALVSVFLLFIVWWGRRTERAKSATPEGEEHTRPVAAPPEAPPLTSLIMSYLLGSAGPIEPVADRLHATPQNEVQGVANGRKSVNNELPAQGVAQPIVPEAAREIIQFWTRVEAVEDITRGGKVGMVEAIELVFKCKRNGRPDSVYGRARAAIQARETPQYIHQLTPEQKRLREELALE
jgi:hypothetical protein